MEQCNRTDEILDELVSLTLFHLEKEFQTLDAYGLTRLKPELIERNCQAIRERGAELIAIERA